jgi:hypothetical protein
MEILRQKLHVLKLTRAVREQYGKGVLSQFIEIARLRMGATGLAAEEYYFYRLFDDHQHSWSDKLTYGGTRLTSRIYRNLINVAWDAVLTDKLVFYAVASALGLPCPSVHAIACPVRRNYGSVPSFSPVSEVNDFLRHDMPYPFFVKPVKSSKGRGAVAVIERDPTSDVVTLGDGGTRSLTEFVAGLSDPEGSGLMFLELLRPHPDVADLGARAVSSVRMVVLLHDRGPELARAAWKIPVGASMADGLLLGNVAANVDTRTGAVTGAISGTGLEQEEVEVHPDTGMPIVGVAVPDWSTAVELCMKAAPAFPAVRWQNWDIALTSRGPVILELNTPGGLRLVPSATRAGIYDEQFREFLRDYKIEQPDIL